MNASVVNGMVIAGYFALMTAIGWQGRRRVRGSADFLLAGRSLGPVLYCSTMGALVIGGGSTVGGVGLGFQHGLCGMWMVVAIGFGAAGVSLLLAGKIRALRVYTIAEMLALRYGMREAGWSGLVMVAHVFLVSVTSTVAYATVFHALLGLGHIQSTLLGGAVVVCYCVLGGMWSISVTDVVQFAMKTAAVFFLLLPAALSASGGLAGAQEKFRGRAFDPFALGWKQILTFFVLYAVGSLVSQDLWQRAATARSASVARWAGAVSGLYCVAYGVAVALIGTAGALLLPALGPSQVYGALAVSLLPPVLSALVLAGAMAAMMSTASGSILAAATVARRDIAPLVLRALRRPDPDEARADRSLVRLDRWYVLAFGLANVLVACFVDNVLAALAVGYAIVVSALIVPVFGGFLWKRANGAGALAAMASGAAGAVFELLRTTDPEAITPVYLGLVCSAVVFVVVSLLTSPTPASVREQWAARLRSGRSAAAHNSASERSAAETVSGT
ncbi:Na+/solute symporter [Segniliparus rotundus DSM 44985]|uniref:Na+/solute symporter n=1 Tax=Segniliparus rotundus (strain ATCC BAA-972 / CDC 1076 / CIP 108378 / DSM 44985 / JCM 13578) TaxID=640132 RepID=D6Z9V4_SEGRD|nr:sodium:solute symporter [Segniliparus rotundus]ADG98624.1 Na+/solute symporter [Segniliparus rotundus DSM 44985]